MPITPFLNGHLLYAVDLCVGGEQYAMNQLRIAPHDAPIFCVEPVTV